MIIEKIIVFLIMILCILIVIYLSPNIIKFVENKL